MKEISNNTSVCTFLTLDYLYRKGTIAVVEKLCNQLKSSLDPKLIQVLNNEENITIYLTYYMLYKFPSLNEKLATFTDSFENEIKMYINIIFNEFISLYTNLELENDEYIISIYKDSLDKMFNETINTNNIKRRINNPKIHSAALIYFMSGNNFYIKSIDREIDELEIENYIYNDISCLDGSLKSKKIKELKGMSLEECKDYIRSAIEAINLFDISSILLGQILSKEKTELFEIIITCDEQIKTMQNNMNIQQIRSGN